MGKVVSTRNIKRTLNNKRLKRKKIVFFSGAFDLFHYGHFIALKKASALGDILVIQIDGNRLVKKRKGPDHPYLDQSERALIIASFGFVDYVFISSIPSEDSRILKSVRPDIFVRAILPHESEKTRARREKVLLKKVAETKIFWLDQTPEISTTKIISAVEKANNAFIFRPKKFPEHSFTNK